MAVKYISNWGSVVLGEDRKHTISKQRIAVSVIEALGRGQALDGVVAVAVVGGALDLRQVGALVEGGGGLVLSVALGAEGGQGAEVQRARGHEAAGGHGVGEDVAGAVSERVGAVLRAHSRGGAAALGRDLVEDAGNSAAGRRCGRLEVLSELSRVTTGGGSGGLAGKGCAVAQCSALGSTTGTSAIGLDHGALRDVVVEVTADLGGSNTIDMGLEDVAVKGHGAINASAVRRGGQERSSNKEVEVTAGTEIVYLGGVELGLNTLTGGEGLESILRHVAGLDLETDTIKRNLVGCTSHISLSERRKRVESR